MNDFIKDCVVIVPTYNESENIEKTLIDLKKYFTNILIVDDGSEDNTKLILNRMGSNSISHAMNIGQGGSIGTGLSYFINNTNFEYAITFDADGQHRADQALEMLNYAFSENLDAVIGSRFANKESFLKIPMSKRITLILASLYESIFYSIPFKDAHNGLRVLRRSLVENFLLPLEDFDMNHATEISYKIIRSGKRFKEYPVDIIYKNKSSQGAINAINIALSSILNKK